MVDRIWIHIGAEKTGTTTIQKCLKLNRSKLADRGVLFPRSVGEFNHIALAAYAMNDGRGIEELRIQSGVRNISEIPEFRDNLKASLIAETEASGCHTVVMSNEHCSSRLKSIEEIERLRDLCLSICSDIRIILYIRNPVDFFASWYSTAIASGNTFDFPNPVPDHLLRAADWLAMARDWARVFGTHSVSVRRMDKSKLVDGDLLKDFFHTISLPEFEFDVPPRTNEALPLKGLLFLQQINDRIPRIVDNRMNEERGPIVDALRAWPEKTKYAFSQEFSDEIEDYYKQSYEVLRQLYFGDDTSDLFSEPSSVGQANDIAPLTVDDCLDLAAHIWKYANSKVRR
ncbi:hypothetical protein RGQ15_13480 [Paracoccus sp. MBLB3053]|uniref:Sulfotransferase domain-containing protein n=1 Tax=Paracoccus aurantius TaxID=3073814 RepID=A0ABU2HVJ8_9RHOB|nr:hypothetical protein [Paracoccus sp. MBLB3053]MDS9468575.1 hypothetical protein [Paracoccus sp. MBLB3053]